MATFLSSPGFLKALYAGNALWHSTATVNFLFRGPFMMQKLARRDKSTDPAIASSPRGDGWHHDIMKYLGGLNSPFVLLALFRLYNLVKPSRLLSTGTTRGDLQLDFMALAVLGLGNFSQAILNFIGGRQHNRWIMGQGLDRITVFDCLFAVLDWAAALQKILATFVKLAYFRRPCSSSGM